MAKERIAIIVIHEIYGVNQHIKDVKVFLEKSGAAVYTPDLLSIEEPFAYSEEEKAYANFMENVGFEKGARQIERLIYQLKQQFDHVGIIGFSVGATIAWLCSIFHELSFAVCCYGSRIRSYTSIEPNCPILLIFPAKEQSFDPEALIENLKQKRNEKITIQQFSGSHGFIDPYSDKYEALAAEKALRLMEEFIYRLC
ncbi:dienelactone hydrolase family protein [Bacillus gobiensis]|uniref:dienelactone hydrolase family protein n=1 Tax=Bacillus gobiensis TaxID=1441095 RepID=UPI003D245F1F